MAIADTINSMKTNITNAYNAVQTKGGTIPTNKNLENLSTAINSITAGGGIEDVATEAALKAKCTADNAGKIYRYTGTTSGNFINGALYIVDYHTYDDYYEEYRGYDLGLEIYKPQDAPYTITWNLTYCSVATSDEHMDVLYFCGSKKVRVTATADYILPENITVTGCSYNWNKSSTIAMLELYNPTGNITVSITAELDFSPDTIIAWYNSIGVVGFEPCIQTWTTQQCNIWAANFNAFNNTYTYVLDKLGNDPAETVVYECIQLLESNLGGIFKDMGIEWSVKGDVGVGEFTIRQMMSNGTAASTGVSYIKG